MTPEGAGAQLPPGAPARPPARRLFLRIRPLGKGGVVGGGLALALFSLLAWNAVDHYQRVIADIQAHLTGHVEARVRRLAVGMAGGQGLAAAVVADAALILSRHPGFVPPEAWDDVSRHVAAMAPSFRAVVGLEIHDADGREILEQRAAPKGLPGDPPATPVFSPPSAGVHLAIDAGGDPLRLTLPVPGGRAWVTAVLDGRWLLEGVVPAQGCAVILLDGRAVARDGVCSARDIDQIALTPPDTPAWEAGAMVGVVRSVPGTGLVVGVLQPKGPSLAAWRRHIALETVLALAVLVIGGVSAALWRRKAERWSAVEAAARRREDRLVQAVRGSGCGFWDWDLASSHLTLLDGPFPIDPDGDGLTLVHPTDRERVVGAFAAHLNAPQAAVDLRCRLIMDGGRSRWIRFRGRAVVEPGQAQDGAGARRLCGLWFDISDQTALDLERRQLAAAVENSPVAVLMSDPLGRIKVASRRIEAMAGLDPARLPGQPLSRLWSSDTPAATQASLASALEAAQPWDGDVVCGHPDGRRLWHHVSIAPVRDGDGALTGFVSVHEDITERHRLQERLRYQVSTVNAVLEASPSAILVADLDGRPRLVNQRLRALWGLQPADIRDQTPWALFSLLAARIAEPRDFLDGARALTNSPGEVEEGCDLLLSDGRVLQRHSLAVAGEDGANWGRVWFFSDVTEHKRAERALSDQLEFQHTLINTLPNPVFYTDRIGRLLGCNRAFADLLGLTPAVLLDRPLVEVLVGRVPAETLGQVAQGGLDKGDMQFFEASLLDPCGRTRMLAVARAAFADADGEVSGIVAVMTDITDLKRAAEELRRSNQELEQFAYVASHDLQEPLRMVSSYLGLLRRRYSGALDQDAHDFIRFATEGAHRMQALIQDLLQFSRIDIRGTPFVRVCVGECLNLAIENLRVSLQEADAHLDVGPLPEVLADGAQITSLFQNLIGNAVKYRAPERPIVVRISAERRGDVWEIAVGDNGIGIDPRFADKVFMIFQRLQTRDRYEGTGIGLALAKKIVERHGGRIWLEGAEGVGTTFRFTLPAVPGPVGATASAPLPSRPAA